MSVIISGGTGFIGSRLTTFLATLGYAVIHISRKPPDAFTAPRMTWMELSKRGLPENTVAVVNLAGEPLLDPMKRWNDQLKEVIYNSRIMTTRDLVSAITTSKCKPKVFVSMSGVGYYKPDPTAEYTEESPGGEGDFVAELSRDWEAAAQLPSDLKVRKVIVRSGVVLGRSGGMISRIYWPFFMGMGGPFGSGSQWFPWVHLDDVAGIITHAIVNDHVEGVLNAVSPNPVTNREFSSAFASSFFPPRPSLLAIPEFVCNAMFGEERAKVLLEGQRVLPKRTLASGYRYFFPDLQSTCKDCAYVINERQFMEDLRTKLSVFDKKKSS